MPILDMNITLYADHTILYCSVDTSEETLRKSQERCIELEGWCNIYCLRVNTTETKRMFINPREEDIDLYLKL